MGMWLQNYERYRECKDTELKRTESTRNTGSIRCTDRMRDSGIQGYEGYRPQGVQE